MVARLKGSRDLRPRRKGTQRKAVGNAFGGDQNIGIDAVMLISKHFAGAAEAGLDFVGDKEDAVLVENLLHFFEVIRRRHDDATLAHYRFGNESGDIGGSGKTNDVI